MVLKRKYPRQKVIAIDVDNTLLNKGKVNKKLVEWCIRRKEENFTIIIWSSRGERYAKRAAHLAGLTDIATHIISKPGYIVDDQGWSWIKFTIVIKRLIP